MLLTSCASCELSAAPNPVRGGGAGVWVRGGVDERGADAVRGGLFLRGRRGGARGVLPGDGVPRGRPRGAAGVLLERLDACGQRDGGIC